MRYLLSAIYLPSRSNCCLYSLTIVVEERHVSIPLCESCINRSFTLHRNFTACWTAIIFQTLQVDCKCATSILGLEHLSWLCHHFLCLHLPSTTFTNIRWAAKTKLWETFKSNKQVDIYWLCLLLHNCYCWLPLKFLRYQFYCIGEKSTSRRLTRLRSTNCNHCRMRLCTCCIPSQLSPIQIRIQSNSFEAWWCDSKGKFLDHFNIRCLNMFCIDNLPKNQ